MAKAALKNCPICKKPSVEKFNPFCSSRCADIDLGKWLGERYRVPTNEGPEDRDQAADEAEN
jgi:uncharacterized protein